MTTLQQLKEIAEIRIYPAELIFDKKRRVAVNVKLCSFLEYEPFCDELGTHPAAFLAGQFLDPNTGEKLFTASEIEHLPKAMVMRLARLWIDVQLNRAGAEEEEE